jgi:hypothetical protein
MRDAAEELAGKFGCVVILIGLALITVYLERQSSRYEKAKKEATERIWKSLNQDVQTVLSDLDSSTKEPDGGSWIPGGYLVWELEPKDESTGHQVDPPDKTKGAAQSFSIRLDKSELINLQTSALKVIFKAENIERDESLLNFLHTKIHGFIGSPYREGFDGRLTIECSEGGCVYKTGRYDTGSRSARLS